ncbi:MAG: amidohydrolase [Candidatus Asgardarchaeia archaeon]
MDSRMGDHVPHSSSELEFYRENSLLIRNGKVYTLNGDDYLTDSILVFDGKVVALGRDADYLKPHGVKVLDIKGRVILPAFIDSHTHFSEMGMNVGNLDLSNFKSIKDIVALIKEVADKRPEGEWIIGYNWDESRLSEGRYINRSDIESATDIHPVILTRIDGHMAVINSIAAEKLGITGKLKNYDPENGILKEEALEFAREKIRREMRGIERIVDCVEEAMKIAFKNGVSSVHETVFPENIIAYQEIQKDGRLKTRVYLKVWYKFLDEILKSGIRTRFGNSFLRIGSIKFMVDGSVGAKTAAFFDPYVGEENRGLLLMKEEEVEEYFEIAHKSGFQIAVHAIGDRAIETVLDAFKNVLKNYPRNDHRHRIEHFEFPTEDQIDRARKMGLIASMQPNFVANWGKPGGLYEERLGRERMLRNNPFKLILDKGMKLAFGSDCMPFGPMYGIWGAVNHPVEDSRIGVKDAIIAYTSSGAYASFEEDLKGTLEVGKLADMVILSGDPYEVPPKKIREIKVLGTIIGGGVVFKNF